MLAALVAGSVASAWYFRRAPDDAPEMRVQIVDVRRAAYEALPSRLTDEKSCSWRR